MAAPVPRQERHAAAADVTGFSSSAWSAPEFDLASAAELCVDLGRLVNGRDLPGLMARAATVLAFACWLICQCIGSQNDGPQFPPHSSTS